MSQIEANATAPKSETFLENMRRLREERGLSYSRLARELTARGFRIHQPALQRIEAGDRPLRLAEAEVVADYFGLSLEHMLSPIHGGTKRSELVALLAEAAKDFTRAEFQLIELSAKVYGSVAQLDAAISEMEDDGAMEDLQVRAKSMLQIGQALLGAVNDAVLKGHALVDEDDRGIVQRPI